MLFAVKRKIQQKIIQYCVKDKTTRTKHQKKEEEVEENKTSNEMCVGFLIIRKL